MPNITPDFLPIDLMWRRAEESRGGGGRLDFDELLYLGEGVLKTYVAGMIAAIGDDTSHQRYKLSYKLVRANSIGDWDDILSEISTGISAQYILPDAIDVHHELVARAAAGTWIHEAVSRLHGVLQSFVPNVEPLSLKVDLRKWFNTFVQLRNKTRGHGAHTEIQKQSAAAELEASTRLVTANCKLFRRQWVYLKRNLSNKYNVLPLGAATFKFDHLRGDRSTALTDGIYVNFGNSAWVELIDTSVDLVDFFYPNGHFRAKKMEWLSYISGSRRERDATPFLPPASQLPPSHTAGDNSMRVVGRCFANLPPSPKDYIPRAELEAELEKMLENDRHPVVTLVGRGGIGKTSLALRVLHHLAGSDNDRFFGMLWLSARDIDLLPAGAKLVKPSVLSIKDIIREIVALMQPTGASDSQFDKEKYVAELLRSQQDALLMVFDNFETVQQPLDVFAWLDQNIRSPNKILITTRHRDFRGDYAVEVGGMTEKQCNDLVRSTASLMGMQGKLTTDFFRDVYKESEGHPYVVKILVGEAAEAGRFRKIERIVAGKEEILDALFERTYTRLSPAARRVFLTLSGWRSVVPAFALEAALLRRIEEDRIDLGASLDELKRVSFVDEYTEEADTLSFYSVPLVAAVFGKRKLTVSQDRAAIEEDIRYLHRFGAIRPPEIQKGIRPRISAFFASLSDDLEKGKLDLNKESPTLELIARQYPPAWLLVAQLWTESGKDHASTNTRAAILRYLETVPGDLAATRDAWQRVADISRRERDWMSFVNAAVQIAELPDSTLHVISNTVNTFNSVKHEFDIEPEQLKAFARRLAAAMEARITEANATDCSRLAWLLMLTGSQSRASEVVQIGLSKDPENEHCRKLEGRLVVEIAQAAGRLF